MYSNWEYFMMLGGCLLCVTLAGVYFGVVKKLLLDWKRLAISLGVTFGVFSVWDWWAIGRKHWWFNAKYVTGMRILGVPVEELVFFLVIPWAGLLTWKIIKLKVHAKD